MYLKAFRMSRCSFSLSNAPIGSIRLHHRFNNMLGASLLFKANNFFKSYPTQQTASLSSSLASISSMSNNLGLHNNGNNRLHLHSNHSNIIGLRNYSTKTHTISSGNSYIFPLNKSCIYKFDVKNSSFRRHYSSKNEKSPSPPTPSPSKLKRQEFLSKYTPARNPLQTLRLKLKWFLLRSNRPFNIDELSAFLSWILMGNFIWILIGTTTFVGLIIYLINLLSNGDGQTINNKWILEKLITFDNKLCVEPSNESEFIAEWKDGTIQFKNLLVRSSPSILPDSDASLKVIYNFKIDTISLTLSFKKWLDGKGLIKDVSLNGVTGDISLYKTILSKDDNGKILDRGGVQCVIDESFPENYEFENFKIKDLKVLVKTTNSILTKEGKLIPANDNAKIIELSIFTCALDRLRRNWVTYDFLNASSFSGSLNGSLFTLHKRQNQLAHFSALDEYPQPSRQKPEKPTTGLNSTLPILPTKLIDDSNDNEPWKKITRLHVDQLDLSYLHNEECSKLNWIQSGKADLIIDIMLPNDDKEDNLMLSSTSDSIWSNMKNTVSKFIDEHFTEEDVYQSTTVPINITPDQSPSQPLPLSSNATTTTSAATSCSEEQNRYVVMDIKLVLSEVKASMPKEIPYSTLTDSPYISRTDLQSLITFINDKKFGLSRILNANNTNYNREENGENPFDGSELPPVIDHHSQNTATTMKSYLLSPESNSIPPIKFRLVHNIKDFEYIDLMSLLTLSDMSLLFMNDKDSTRTTQDATFNNISDDMISRGGVDGVDPRLMKMFQNTNKFVDGTILEVLSYLMLYKEEIQFKLIEVYSKRTNFEIFFNNLILGNLIIVGLGSFVI